MFEYAIEVLDTTIYELYHREECDNWSKLVEELEKAIEILKREDK